MSFYQQFSIWLCIALFRDGLCRYLRFRCSILCRLSLKAFSGCTFFFTCLMFFSLTFTSILFLLFFSRASCFSLSLAARCALATSTAVRFGMFLFTVKNITINIYTIIHTSLQKKEIQYNNNSYSRITANSWASQFSQNYEYESSTKCYKWSPFHFQKD